MLGLILIKSYFVKFYGGKNKIYQNSVLKYGECPIFDSLSLVQQSNLQCLTAHWPHLWSSRSISESIGHTSDGGVWGWPRS